MALTLAGATLGASALGVLGSLGSSLAGSALSAYEQQQLMSYQAKLNYKYGKKTALNQYGWQREGLEKAGYNPLLALGGAEGVPSTGWSSANGYSANVENPLNSAIALMANKRDEKLNEANVDNINTDTDTKRANMNLIAQQIVGQQLENSYYSRQKESEIALSNAEQFMRLASMQEALERTKWIGPTAQAQIESMMKHAEASLKQADTSALDSWRRYNVQTNYRDDDISIHGPLGIGVSVGSKGYKPNKSERSRKKPIYRTETLKNGNKIKVKVYD